MGQTPAKKTKIAKAEPVAKSTYADISKVLPDSDPTNKSQIIDGGTRGGGCGGGGTSSDELQGKLECYSIWL